MATTIRSTELDFDTIKNNLKLFLAQKEQFSDYNFEASGVSNLLDVMAYNTHYNALLANFALNESFLATAQLRSSLVGLASSLGYIVGSRTASFAVLRMYLDYSSDVTKPASVTMPKGTEFTTSIDNKTYTFKTRDVLTAQDDGNGLYYFSVNGNTNVSVFEGNTKTKTFIAGPVSENDSYVIPESRLDLDTVEVRVYNSPSDTAYDVYTNLNVTTNINALSKIFVIKETPNGFYEVTFSNGTRLGLSPQSGNKIEIIYDVVAGPDGNGARTFTPSSNIEGKEINITTTTLSSGGSIKESVESIRKNAPYQYATQNRAVTSEDYSSLILREYGNVVSDVKSWGGEENIPPQYGTVFTSLVFKTTDPTIIQSTKDGIRSLLKDLAVVSFSLEFTDPIETFIEAKVFFQFNQNLTSLNKSSIESTVKTTMSQYFDANLGDFDQSFRRSNLLTLIDETDPSVLSSRATIEMQNRFVPVVGQTNYKVYYPASIKSPDETEYTILSKNFRYKGDTCYLRNKLGSTTLELFNVNTGLLALDNVGSYDAISGTLNLENFVISLISGDHVKINAIPANQSAITPVRESILKYDAASSSASAVLTDAL
tara:strand:- start:8670 stop:10466 length:1797 start_codon:yes stop_codon:yes gene_type:complete